MICQSSSSCHATIPAEHIRPTSFFCRRPVCLELPAGRVPVSGHSEADLGMFSMFGRTGAPTKAQKNISCCNSSVHCSTGPLRNVHDDYCACRVKVVGGRGGGFHILGAPTFFLNRGPVRGKSGPADIGIGSFRRSLKTWLFSKY